MLIRFSVSNFRSLRDKQEVSMVAAFKDNRPELFHSEALGVDLLRVAGIYGPNASGKSNILEALKFLSIAVKNSHRQWKPDGPIPYEPFLLDSMSREATSLFEIEFLLEGAHFQYGVELNSKKIVREWLNAYPNKRRQTLFARETQQFKFNKLLKGNNKTIEGLTRPNSLFLSAAAENNHLSLSPVYGWLANSLIFISPQDELARQQFSIRLTKDETTRTRLIELIQLADLGITSLDVKEAPLDTNTKELVKTIVDFVHDKGLSALGLEEFDPFPLLELQHRSSEGTVSLPINKESRGTQAWFSLGGSMLHALDRGATLCVDELDASLHPRLALEVLRIFQDPNRNPNCAQLLFNTHDTSLLGNLFGAPGLYRDQIWLTEKDENGATHLYPLTDFKPRKHENLERGYLQGRYGAIPFVEAVSVDDNA